MFLFVGTKGKITKIRFAFFLEPYFIKPPLVEIYKQMTPTLIPLFLI